MTTSNAQHKTSTGATDPLAKFGTGALAVHSDLPEWAREINTNEGNEGVGQDDILIPRLALAQAGLSPQLKKQSELFIPGLEEGQLFNSVNNEIYGTSVCVVPLIFFKQFIEFNPMDEGGGVKQMFQIGEIPPSADLQWEGGKPPKITEFKNRLCLLIREGHAPELIVVSLKSTGIKTAKKWNSLIKRFPGKPAFISSYTLKVVSKSKGQQSWYGLDVATDVIVPQEFYLAAKKYFDDLTRGGYRVDITGLENEEPREREPGEDPEY